MKIPYMDLRVKSEIKKKQLLLSVSEVLSHGRLILGPEVNKLKAK
jgi:hypothetical protein